jgi:hypothetical protein
MPSTRLCLRGSNVTHLDNCNGSYSIKLLIAAHSFPPYERDMATVTRDIHKGAWEFSPLYQVEVHVPQTCTRSSIGRAH